MQTAKIKKIIRACVAAMKTRKTTISFGIEDKEQRTS